MSSISKLNCSRMGLAIVILQMALCLISMLCLVVDSETATLQDEDLFRRYKPIAMDESWALVRNQAAVVDEGIASPKRAKSHRFAMFDEPDRGINNPKPVSNEDVREEFDELLSKAENEAGLEREQFAIDNITDSLDPPMMDAPVEKLPRTSRHRLTELPPDIGAVPLPGSSTSLPMEGLPAAPAPAPTASEPIPPPPPPQPPILPPILDIADSDKVNITENLFSIPKVETPRLTQMISSGQDPTFVHEDVVMPIISKDRSKKVLASYRILVPIYIPAVRSPSKRIVVEKPEVKYVKESHTELVPIKKTSPRVKTVYKAEPLPQEIVTDFVKSDRVNIAPPPNDQIGSGEQIIKSTVTNIP